MTLGRILETFGVEERNGEERPRVTAALRSAGVSVWPSLEGLTSSETLQLFVAAEPRESGVGGPVAVPPPEAKGSTPVTQTPRPGTSPPVLPPDGSSRSSSVTDATGEPDEARIEVSPIGMGLALVGALGMIIAVFLPRVESTAFLAGVAENSLIQSGNGFWFIVLAAAIAGAVYKAYRQGTRTVAVVVLGLVTIAIAAYEGTNEESLTLYPVNPQGDISSFGEGEKASPGVGIYLAGVGGLLAALGGLQMRSGSARREGVEGPERTKTCPECAETVLAAANVCRYCGHRFAQPVRPSP